MALLTCRSLALSAWCPLQQGLLVWAAQHACWWQQTRVCKMHVWQCPLCSCIFACMWHSSSACKVHLQHCCAALSMPSSDCIDCLVLNKQCSCCFCNDYVCLHVAATICPVHMQYGSSPPAACSCA